MKSHPAAAVFPLMEGADLEQLADDIREHGLIDPIVTHDGLVLDGRNRLRACELAGVEPQFVEWDPNGLTPTEYAVSVNVKRRHLTTAQRAVLALDLLPKLEEEAKERLKTARPGVRGGSPSPESDEAMGRADEKAAELVGVGRSTVAATKAIRGRDPGIVDRMRAGELNVSQASRAAGFEGMAQGRTDPSGLETGRIDAAGRVVPVFYGKGDKFWEAMKPASRYAKAWTPAKFSACNPAEARRRLKLVIELQPILEIQRRELEWRSVTANLTRGK